MLRNACVVAWLGKYTFLALQFMLNLALRRECRWLLAKAINKESKKENPQLVKTGTYYRRWNTMLTEVSKYKHDAWLMSSRVSDMPKSLTVNWKQMGRVNMSKELHLKLEFLRALFHLKHCDEWSTISREGSTFRHAHGRVIGRLRGHLP